MVQGGTDKTSQLQGGGWDAGGGSIHAGPWDWVCPSASQCPCAFPFAYPYPLGKISLRICHREAHSSRA